MTNNVYIFSSGKETVINKKVYIFKCFKKYILYKRVSVLYSFSVLLLLYNVKLCANGVVFVYFRFINFVLSSTSFLVWKLLMSYFVNLLIYYYILVPFVFNFITIWLQNKCHPYKMSQRLWFNCKSKDVDVIIREIVVQTRNFVKFIPQNKTLSDSLYLHEKGRWFLDFYYQVLLLKIGLILRSFTHLAE